MRYFFFWTRNLFTSPLSINNSSINCLAKIFLQAKWVLIRGTFIHVLMTDLKISTFICSSIHIKKNKTAYQPQVSATEFLNSKSPHALFQTAFFYRDYQNPYVKSQLNNEEFTQRRRQQQLLTCNTPSSKGYSWCFITYSVLTGKKQ